MSGGGLQLPDSLRWVADTLGRPWPDTDESALTELGGRFASIAAGFTGRQALMAGALGDMIMSNQGPGLTAFGAFNAKAYPLTQTAKMAAEVLGAAYLTAGCTALLLKLRCLTLFNVALVPLTMAKQLPAPLSTAAVTWVKTVIDAITKCLDEAVRSTLDQLEKVFRKAAEVIELYEKAATVQLRARPADQQRSNPTQTKPPVPTPVTKRAETNGRDPTDRGIDYTRRWADGNQDAQDSKGVQPHGTHVPYGSTELGQRVIDERRKLHPPSNRAPTMRPLFACATEKS